MVRETKKPISVAEDVEKTLIMFEKNSAQHVDLEDPAESADTTGRTKKLMVTG